MKVFYRTFVTMVLALVVALASADVLGGLTAFNITDNADGTVTIAPNPESTSWAAFAYQEDAREEFLMNFGMDASLTDAEVLSNLLTFGVPVTKGAGEGDFDIVDFMDNFGGAEAGNNYVVAVAELNGDGEVTGVATTKSITLGAGSSIEEVTLDVLTDYTAYAANDQYFEFQNEDYLLQLDLNEVPQVGKEYTMANCADANYTSVKSKNEIVANKYGTKEWKKYLISELSVKFTEVDVENKVFKCVATVKAENGEDVINAQFTYSAPETITVKLTGECEYIADMDIYSFTAKNKGSELKEDYSFSLGIKGESYAKGQFGADDLFTLGNKIKVAAGADVKISSVNLFLSNAGNTQMLMGDVEGADGKTYYIEITTNVPETEGGDVIEDTIGAVLEVSEDEGDIKLKAQNGKSEFVGYISCATTDVPSGSYALLSYSKYGEYNETFGMYMSDRFQDGHVDVVNENGTITITASFKQNGKTYSVVASTPAASTKFTIAENEDGTVTITPSPEETSWAVICYPEAERGNFLMNFGIFDDSMSDAAAISEMIGMYVPVTKGAGEGDFDIADFMENFGGAEDGNYVISVVELDAEGNVTGEATTKTVAFVAPEEIDVVALDVLTDYTAYAANDQYFEFQNEDYLLQLDLNEVPQVGKEYTMANCADANYTSVKSKNEIVANKYGTKEWKKYLISELSVKFTEVDVENKVFKCVATVKAENGEDVIKAQFIYNAPEFITVKLTGKCEYIADMDIYSFTAKNKGSELKEDYSFSLGIKGESYAKGKFGADDIFTLGNKIKVAAGADVKISSVNLFLTNAGDTQMLMGDVEGADGKTYSIEITTNIPSTEPKTEEVDLAAVLEIAEDEGDIKLKAVNAEHEFVGYITCGSTDVPSGEYTLLSYSKYGDYNSNIGMYMSERFQDGKVTVTNEGGTISIVATFVQNGVTYTVKASKSVSDGINDATVAAAKAGKFIENGKLVIVKGGKKYGVNAVEVK